VTDPSRLASILQFEETPKESKLPFRPAISIDCEMGYTTLGMEVIRLTALSWPESDELIDVLVRPVGEVLDLNTRFSGVSLDQFNKAIPFESKAEERNDSASEDGELEPELRKVESPAAARKLLLDRIGHQTALIGHAIENDLNVLRVMHPFVVDTVLLYPHPRGLPARYGLKTLTNKYLERDIQNLDTGHDSKEDAKATGELVRLKAAEKWAKMRSEGWKFEKGLLIPPEESEPRPKKPKPAPAKAP
jgi:DNA polymerase III epsilon subunit-like protein